VSLVLRLGMVGCGQIAQAHAAALRILAEDGIASLVAVADPDPSGMDRVAAIAGTVERRSPSGDDVIADPDVDAVVVITPTRFHRDVICEVADAGKPLFTEKPLAPQFDTVREIVDVVARAGIPAQVGFQSRFHPIIRHLHETVTSGELGAVMAYSIRDDQFWPTGEVVDGHTSWRSRAADAGGGALLEHSIHSCDVACWLFGPVTRVHAVTRRMFGFDVEDTAALTIEHESGVVGNLVTIFNGVQDREERRIELFFENGVIEATTDFLVGAPEDSLLRKTVTGPAEQVDCHELRRAMLLREGLDPDRQFWVYQYLAHRAFAASLARGVAPSPGLGDALEAHRLVEAGYRSAAAGRPVAVSELDER
jgi:predicted dehydrogenase